MCGIVAIVAAPPAATPDPAVVLGLLDEAVVAAGGMARVASLGVAAGLAGRADALLKGAAGVRLLVERPSLAGEIRIRLDRLDHAVEAVERWLEEGGLTGSALEEANAAVVHARDVLWAIRKDRLRTAAAVAELAGRDAGAAGLAAWTAVQQALSSIDRLEVRGRDSAGLHLFVWDHGLDLASPGVLALLDGRAADPLFTNRSVRVAGSALSFVYKAAAEIGELGDNTRALRSALHGDELLRLALQGPAVRASVLAHTRWASVGIISEPNTHPVNHEEDGVQGPYVVAALNGDVDNHADLKAAHGLHIPALVTTDAKVIPAIVSRQAAAHDLTEAFRRTVSSFEGSVAIAMQAADDPGKVWLALRGSGQGLYVGLADGAFVVASEPYGLVEETATYLRMDGETPARAGEPATNGQVVVLDPAAAGTLAGIRRLAYDGSELPVHPEELHAASVTTRDIDRGDAPHFLLKEITEAPASFRKTLRGKIVEEGGRLRVALGAEALPADVVDRLARGELRRVVVIGQGTAAVAGQSLAATLRRQAGSRLQVDAEVATELSGFGMSAHMDDLLVVAVSQSGTTTDTNRTVDLARSRGAAVIAIVNRRNSDLTDKADGVLYTSDGRDVEMSVASTKAFYAQVAAGVLLACAIAEAAGVGDPEERHELLGALRRIPDAMREVLALRPEIAEAARRFAPSRRYWAIVGSGPNRMAAEEVRIKLSELCYRAIACDATEDKKHIDLSSEPLILVCAAGIVGSTADDLAKEVAIFRAHKAAPVVVASDGSTERYTAALQVITVPVVHERLDFVLATVVGHLFGYEAALAIDALARPLREAREAVEAAVKQAALAGEGGDAVLATLRRTLAQPVQRFLDGLRAGHYDGNLEASTAVRLASIVRYATTPTPLDAYQIEYGKVGTPGVLVEDLTAALTRGIEELTRPVDAIKHQAKTVTVGISRSDEALTGSPLVQEVLAAGAARDRLTYREIKVLADLAPAVEAVTGWTRYRIEGDPAVDATISVVDKAGVALDLPSRVEQNPELRGTKRRVAIEGRVFVARGRNDGRTVVLVPERKGGVTTGLTLLHVRFHDRLPVAVARGVLQGYHDRYALLVDTVSETEPAFREDLLAGVPTADLLTVPVHDLAERWRSR